MCDIEGLCPSEGASSRVSLACDEVWVPRPGVGRRLRSCTTVLQLRAVAIWSRQHTVPDHYGVVIIEQEQIDVMHKVRL